MWQALNGQTAPVHPFPPMNPSVPPPTATLNRTPAVPVQTPAVPAGFQHLQSQSKPESSPAYETWPTEEGQKMQVDPYPPMTLLHLDLNRGLDHLQVSSTSRSRTPTLEPPSPAPLQRPSIAQGMQRFLNVLNKGVDINLFTSIINDDSQSVPSNEMPPLYKPPPNEPSKLENNWTEPPQNDSHPSQAEQRSRGRSSLGGSTELPNPEGSPKERNNPADDDLNDRGNSQFPLSSASSRPPAEEENPMQLQLQNILKTLGLSLDKEEMSGLTNRTKERLYGKRKDNGQGFHKTSGSEKPREPSPEICDSTSTSIPPRPRPATPPPQHPQENNSMECRKRRRRSPCSQSRDTSSRDSVQSGRSRDKDKRWDTDECGDAGTDKTQDRDPLRDSETDKRQDRRCTGDSGTDKRQVRDGSEDTETDQTWDGDPSGDSGTEKRQQRDPYRDADTDKSDDLQHLVSKETIFITRVDAGVSCINVKG
ncbi:unnamed protein product [Lota lota]